MSAERTGGLSEARIREIARAKLDGPWCVSIVNFVRAIEREADSFLAHVARRALEAWDGTVLPRSHDGMMQERMEDLRAAIEREARPAEGMRWKANSPNLWRSVDISKAARPSAGPDADLIREARAIMEALMIKSDCALDRNPEFAAVSAWKIKANGGTPWFEPFEALALSQASAAAPAPDHVPASQEQEAELDSALGLRTLTIRLPWDVYDVLAYQAAKESLITPAYVRKALAALAAPPAPDVRADHSVDANKMVSGHLAVPTSDGGPLPNGLRQRLKDAVEGECDGLAITDAHADAILAYVLGDLAVPAPVGAAHCEPLTDVQIARLWDEWRATGSSWPDFARAVERAHGITPSGGAGDAA